MNTLLKPRGHWDRLCDIKIKFIYFAHLYSFNLLGGIQRKSPGAEYVTQLGKKYMHTSWREAILKLENNMEDNMNFKPADTYSIPIFSSFYPHLRNVDIWNMSLLVSSKFLPTHYT